MVFWVFGPEYKGFHENPGNVLELFFRNAPAWMLKATQYFLEVKLPKEFVFRTFGSKKSRLGYFPASFRPEGRQFFGHFLSKILKNRLSKILSSSKKLARWLKLSQNHLLMSTTSDQSYSVIASCVGSLGIFSVQALWTFIDFGLWWKKIRLIFRKIAWENC